MSESVIAGVSAALVATAILGATKFVRDRLARGRDIRYIRVLLTEGRTRVMGAKDTFHKGMGATIKEDALRAAQYNLMIRQIGIALERWALNLSHAERRDIYEALDWYHTDGLYATSGDGAVVFKELPFGRWPTTEMTLDMAKSKFAKLVSIKWLGLPDS